MSARSSMSLLRSAIVASTSSTVRVGAVRSFSASSTKLARPLSQVARPSMQRSAVPAFHKAQVRTMFIQTESTPNDSSLKFIPGVPVLASGGTYEFMDLKSSIPSPLASRLLSIEGVTSILYGPDFVTVSKREDESWSLLKPEIFAHLMEHFSSGQPLFKEGQEQDGGAEDTRILDTDSEVVAMIKELLETRVRPAIQEDGGDIEFKGFNEEDGVVKLKLKGSCRGCSSSSVTLKSGIERMLTHYIPEVQLVEQVLDEEELIALEEFAKLEKRLEKKSGKPDMSSYMSH